MKKGIPNKKKLRLLFKIFKNSEEKARTDQNGGVLPGDDGKRVGYGAAGLLPGHGVPLVQALAQAVGCAVRPLPVSDAGVRRGYVVLRAGIGLFTSSRCSPTKQDKRKKYLLNWHSWIIVGTKMASKNIKTFYVTVCIVRVVQFLVHSVERL